MGTPLYMAPEQMADPAVGRGGRVRPRRDLFEILTFERLRSPETLWLRRRADTPSAPERGIAPELETICIRATETEARRSLPHAARQEGGGAVSRR
ncbi:MAG: hypothetical protein IPQ07_35860 [Myxococcales bacterium]|nr:hypothetical protein [Myxococcales bacterium]